MPLTLSVGINKKQGLPDYGSLGASCNLTVELDVALLQDMDTFHRQVRNAYVSCTQAVNDELARQLSTSSATRSLPEPTNGHSLSGNGYKTVQADNGNGHSTSYTNGNGSSSHRASQKQLDFASQLAKQIRGLGVRKLEGLANKMFSKPLVDLTTLDASGLIDTLKAIKEERISLEDALSGVAV